MRFLTLDFETYYDREYSLSKLSTEAYVRDPRFEVIGVSVKVNDEPPKWFSGTMEETAIFLGQLDIPNSFVLAHNAAFDVFILSHQFGLVPRFIFDTLSMARPKHQMTVGGSLKALSDHYTIGVKGDDVVLALGKHRADFTPDELAKYGRYCCNDTQLCYILFQIMKKDLPADEFRVIDLLVRMHIDPLLELDQPLLEKHLVDVVNKKAELLTKIESLAGKDVLMSNPKFASLLQELGVEPPKKISPATGKETFAFSKADEAFKDLLVHPDPRVQTLVSARLGVKSTLEETRTKSFLGISARGTMPIPLGYYKAHTGRAAGEDGINVQNLPRGGTLRRAIRPPKGQKLVAGDSSQIEARITAYAAGQLDLVAAFANGDDIYSEFATEVYGRPVDRKRVELSPTGEKTKPDEAAGQVGKTGILGLGFGMGAEKFQRALKTPPPGAPAVHMPLEDCRRIVRLYRYKYAKIVDLWDHGARALDAIVRGEKYVFGHHGVLYTSGEGIHLPNSMMVRYPGLTFHGGDYFYASDRKEQAEWVKQRLSGRYEPEKLTKIYGGKVVENVVQALARIVVFEQMLAIARRFRVVLTVHDEVVACVPVSRAEEARAFMTEVMSTPPVWAPGLPVACEARIGDSYGEAK